MAPYFFDETGVDDNLNKSADQSLRLMHILFY